MGAGADVWWAEAEAEIVRAEKLKATGDAGGAYYHAGQAVEFALKAIYLKKNNLSELPEACKGAQWHNLALIAERANVKKPENKTVLANWLAAREWSSNARFPGHKRPRAEINDLIVAICNPQHGVMTWLKSIYQTL